MLVSHPPPVLLQHGLRGLQGGGKEKDTQSSVGTLKCRVNEPNQSCISRGHSRSGNMEIPRLTEPTLFSSQPELNMLGTLHALADWLEPEQRVPPCPSNQSKRFWQGEWQS